MVSTYNPKKQRKAHGTNAEDYVDVGSIPTYSILIILMFLFVAPLSAGEITNSNLISYTKKMCKKYDIPFLYVLGIGIVESNFKNIKSHTTNSTGYYDIGVFQLNGRYIKYYENTFWYRKERFNPWNPKHNIEMAIIYLKHLYEYTNNYRLMVMAFHEGLDGARRGDRSGFVYLSKVSHVIANIKVITDNYIYYGEN